MATVQAVLTEYVRNDLADEIQSRWTDDQLLIFYKQAIRRANAVGQQNRLPFMKSKATISLLAGETSFSLPSDFFTPISLTRDDTHYPLKQKVGRDWDLVISTSEMSLWMIEGDTGYVASAPTSDATLTLRYFAQVFPADVELSTQSPWGGKLDEILCGYVIVRAKQVDAMDTSIDVALLNELEANIYAAFSGQEPITIKSRGWLP
jgi:hypothetical protein